MDPRESNPVKSVDDQDDRSLATWAQDSTSLSHLPPVDVFTVGQCGYIAQYFVVGMMMGGVPSTTYGFFLGYLNVSGNVYATAGVMCSIPWSFKIFYGTLHDTVPIFGYHRKCWMMIGWGVCSAAMVALWLSTVPPPYYCRGADGYYTREVCNAAASDEGGWYVLLMTMASFGLVCSDVGADALTVQFARREPVEVRGYINSTMYLTRTIGVIVSLLFVGLFMNGKEYNGSFEHSLTFNQVSGILTVPCVAMIPMSWFFVQESGEHQDLSASVYFRSVWHILESKAMFYVVVYSFFVPVMDGITTPASGLIKSRWIQMGNLQSQMISVIGYGIFALGQWLVRRYFLNRSWTGMILWTTVIMNLVDMFFTFVAVFNVTRNQYFACGDVLLEEIPAAVNFMVSTLIIVEMAEEGTEGVVSSLLTTVGNVGSPVARAMGNQIYAYFRPSLILSTNYDADTVEFRWTVAGSFFLQYGLTFAGLGLLWLFPSQKQECQHRKATWPRHPVYAYTTAIGLAVAIVYSCTMNLLVMFPATACMPVAGGSGC